jgi:hypothetical protein
MGNLIATGCEPNDPLSAFFMAEIFHDDRQSYRLLNVTRDLAYDCYPFFLYFDVNKRLQMEVPWLFILQTGNPGLLLQFPQTDNFLEKLMHCFPPFSSFKTL